jgi:hypothetical protein
MSIRVSAPTRGRYVGASIPLPPLVYQTNWASVPSYDVGGAAIELKAGTGHPFVTSLFYTVADDRNFLNFRIEDQPSCSVTSDAALFQRFVSRWHEERGTTSSITQMAICPSYQRIIGLGDKVVPLILRDLEDHAEDPDHWFWALQALTGHDPVRAEDRGDMQEMARTWLEWAYMAGYDW